MDPQISIEAEFKDGKLQTGLDRAIAKEERMEEGLKKIVREAKNAERESDRFAKRVTEINATPVERYTTAVAKADQALKAGKITQETYNRELTRQRELLESVAHAQQEATGPTVRTEIASLAMNYASMGGAIGFVSEALREVKQDTDNAVRSMRELTDLRIQIGQVGGVKVEQEGERWAREFAIPRREALTFARDAANLNIEEDDAEYIASKRWAIGNVTQMGDLAGLTPKQFPGLGGAEAVNMAGAASETSRMDLATFAPIFSRAKAGSARLGSTPEEVMAATGLMTALYPTAAEAGTQLGTFQVKMSLREQFRGKGLVGTMSALQAMSEAERSAILKEDKETNDLYENYKKIQRQVPGEMSKIAAARAASQTPLDWLSTTQDRNLVTNPKLAADFRLTRSEVSREQAEEEALGRGGASSQEVKNNVMRLLMATHPVGIMRKGPEKMMGYAEEIGVGASGVGAVGLASSMLNAPLAAPFNVGKVFEIFTKPADELSAAAKELRDAAIAVKESQINPSRAIQARAAQRAQ